MAHEGDTGEGPHRFIVSWADEERVVDTRAEAVALARTQSLERRVQVRREDGQESMQYFQGSLETFVYELRERSRRDEPAA